MFRGRNLFIATKHKKEEVIRPIFESTLGVRCIIPENFDSDRLGTFSGEVERNLTPIDTVREKCRLVANDYASDLVIANEGSFGSHPLIGFVPQDEEIVMLVDFKNKLEIRVVERSMKTNFSSEQVSNLAELLKFADKAGFPSHGLILKSEFGIKKECFKGITNRRHLIYCFEVFRKLTDKVTVETDMRAMYNPTRMEVIKRGAIKLAEKIKTSCPKCFTPGFGVERLIRGLPCSQCFNPTKSIKSNIYQCQKCCYEYQYNFPDYKEKEDPIYCDFCNP